MGGGRRRAARRLCLGAAALCAVGSLAAPSSAQVDDVARPEVFRGAASAQVASLEADREALLPIPEVFRFIALDTTSVYETDLQNARASLLFPGNGLILGPNLACGTFAGDAPPELQPVIDTCLQYSYPLSVRADASTPSASTAGAITLGAPTDPVSGDAVSARADAGPDGASSYAAMQDLRVLGLPAFGPVPLPLDELELDTSILTVQDATSRTDQVIDGGVLTVHAEAVLSGVRLVGGLIEIGSIRSLSHVTDDAAGARTAESSLEVSGVTVGGVPAQITEDGLVVGSPSGSSGPLQQQLETALNQLVEALGVRVTLLDAEQTIDDGDGQAVASSGGILIEVATDVQGLPILPGPIGDIDLNGTYVGSIQLGNSAAAAGAVNFDDILTEIDVPTFGPGGGVIGDSGSFDPGALAIPTPPAAGASAPAPAASGPDLVRIFDTFGGRVGLLYLAFALAVLGLCVMPKLAVPARLPGPRS